MDAGEIYEMKVEAGLSSCGDDEQGNEGQRNRAVPEKTYDHQQEKEVKAVEELFVVGVLHLAHPPQLFHPEIDLLS